MSETRIRTGPGSQPLTQLHTTSFVSGTDVPIADSQSAVRLDGLQARPGLATRNAPPTTTLGAVVAPDEVRSAYANAVSRAETMNVAYREQSAIVLGALLRQPLVDLDPRDWGSGRILRDDAQHAALRLNTAMWTVVRDMRSGALSPGTFGKSSWDAVTSQDMYNLGVHRLRANDEDWGAATEAMVADRQTPPLEIFDPQKGRTTLVPANISWWNRSPQGLFAPSSAALELEQMAIGQSMRNAAVRVGGATPSTRAAARSASYIETASTLSNGSPPRTVRGVAQRPLPPNESMTGEALARGTNTLYRLEPVPANADAASLQAAFARQEFVGMVPKTNRDGTTSWYLAKPFRNERDIAVEVMRKLTSGELDHLDPMTQARIRGLCGPANDIGGALTAKLTAQDADQQNRTRVGVFVEMAAMGILAAAGGAVIGVAARAGGMSVGAATVTGTVSQSLLFTGGTQLAAGRFDAWQFPQDLAMFGALSAVGRVAQGMRLWSETSRVGALAATATRQSMVLGAAAFSGTVVNATREVIQTGQFPDATRVREQFTEALITGALLHGVNTTLGRIAPQIGPQAVAYHEYRSLMQAAQARQSEGTAILAKLDQVAIRGATLRDRGLPANDPQRLANVQEQIALMQQFTGVGHQVKALDAQATAFAATHLAAPAAAQARRDAGRTQPENRSGPVGQIMQGDIEAAGTMRMSQFDAATRRQLEPGGAIFADAVRRGGQPMEAMLTMHRMSGTKPEDILIGVGKAYLEAPNLRPRYSDVAAEVIRGMRLTDGWPPGARESGQARIEQVLQRMINFHEPSQWRSVVPELLLDAATPLPTGPNAIPVDQGMARIAQIRAQRSIAGSKNIGYIDYNLEGPTPARGEYEAISGAPKRYPRTATEAELIQQVQDPHLGPQGGNNPRSNDTEWALLENVARRITPETRGTVRLFSERPCCPSCQLVIARFQRTYPNIQLIVSTGPAQ